MSDRNLEALMAERGANVDHFPLYRGVHTFTLPLEAVFRQGQRHLVGTS
ncbi:MAG TPA: hypothetical protein VES89_04685 [Candidatus Competibacteraceae bacterium]|nr:hypothetical protein [Candidatus Competibacteraceae bacterium]